MKWRGTFNSLRSKIFSYTLIFVIIPSVISFLLLNSSLQKRIEQQLGEASQQTLDLAVAGIGDMLENMMSSITVLMLDTQMIQLLKQPEQFNVYERHQIVDSTIRSLMSTYLFNMDSQLTLMDWNHNLYTSWNTRGRTYEDFAAEPWFKQLATSQANFIWMGCFECDGATRGEPMLAVARLIQTPADFQSYGVAVVSVPEKELWKFTSGIEGEIIVLAPDGLMITQSQHDRSLQQSMMERTDTLLSIANDTKGQTVTEMNGTKMMINYSTIDMTGWKVLQIVPYDEVFAEIFALQKVIVLIAVGILLLFIVVGFSIADRVSKPLGLLRKRMQSMGRGEFFQINPMQGTEEITALINTYNDMTEDIKELLERVKHEHAQKEQMRFKALQAQINPHFILNTLNNIKWMAFMRDDREVGEMLSALAAIMEESIGRGNDIVSIRQEIHYIENYLQLQKIRYNEQVSVNYDIDERVYQGQTVKFMLQPIVENSIYHGMSKAKGKCNIDIQARKEQDVIRFIIRDNGVGIPADKLAELRKNLHGEDGTPRTEHLGLKNVHDRIQLTFGKEYGLDIMSEEGQGTSVLIRIPFQEWKEESL